MHAFHEHGPHSEHADQITVSVRNVDDLPDGEGEIWITRVWQNGCWHSVHEQQGRALD